MSDAPALAAPKSGKAMVWLGAGLCLGLSIGAGFLVPQWLFAHKEEKSPAEIIASADQTQKKKAYVPFGDVVVNLNQEGMTRYLRVKLVLVVDADVEQPMTQLIEKHKPVLRNWLISYLADKTLADVKSTTGINRIRRETWQQFNLELFPDGSELIRDVLVEEFVVQ